MLPQSSESLHLALCDVEAMGDVRGGYVPLEGPDHGLIAPGQ